MALFIHEADVRRAPAQVIARPTLTPRPRNVLRFTFDPAGDAQQVYVIEHDDQLTQLPAGADINGARIADGGVPAISQQVDFSKSAVTISAPTFQLVDIDRAFTQLLAEKWANRVSVRYILLELFRHDEGEDLDLVSHREHTFLVEAANPDRGLVSVQCADIQREMISTEIWNLREWTLVEPILLPGVPPFQTRIRVAGEFDDLFFTHADSYPVHPGLRLFYVETPAKEIIAFNGIVREGDTGYFLIHERGCFNTAIATVDVNAEDNFENRPKLNEHVYMHELPASMLESLLSGYTADRRPLPVRWSRGLGDWAAPRSPEVAFDSNEPQRRDRFLKSGSFAAANALQFPFLVQGAEPAKLRDYLEKEVLPILPGVLLPDTEGRLELLIDEPLHPDQAAVITFTESDVDLQTLTRLLLDTSDLGNPIEIKTGYDWRTNSFLNKPVVYDIGAEQLVGGSIEAKSFAYKLLGLGFTSFAQRQKLAVIKSDQHAYPRQRFSIEARPFAPRARLGQVVRVDIPIEYLRNSYSGDAFVTGLDRAFRVVGITGPSREGRVRYTLEGGFGVAKRRAQSQALTYLDDQWYEQFTPITDVIPLSPGNELRGTHVIPPGNYSFLGDLRLRSGLRVTFSSPGNFMLAVRGELINESPNPFNGAGNGLHAGGAGEVSNAGAELGDPGYFGQPIPDGAIYFRGRYRRDLVGGNSDPIYRYTRIAENVAELQQAAVEGGARHNSAVPDWPLAYNNGQLTGIPADLSGSGGRGADAHKYWRSSRADGTYGKFPPAESFTLEHFKNGLDGGRGGMSIGFVSRGGGNVGDGGLVTDGADAATDTATADSTVQRVSGAGGAPGVPWWGMDGPFDLPDMNPVRISARFGAGQRLGRTLKHGDKIDIPGGGQAHSAIASPTNGRNAAGAIAKAFYLPVPETLQEPLSEIEKLFAAQRDGLFVLHITDAPVRPSNADHGDINIYRSDANGSSDEPPAWLYNAARVAWEPLDWSVANMAYRVLLTNYRVTGARRFVSSTTRPPDGTYVPGTLWYNEITEATTRLGTSVDFDQQVLAGTNSVGANLITDSSLERFAESGLGHVVYVPANLPVPVFAVPLQGQVPDILPNVLEAIDRLGYVSESASSITLSWTLPPARLDYSNVQILVFDQSSLLATLGANATEHTITGLTGSAEYAFSVRLTATGGRSDDVNIVATTNAT